MNESWDSRGNHQVIVVIVLSSTSLQIVHGWPWFRPGRHQHHLRILWCRHGGHWLASEHFIEVFSFENIIWWFDWLPGVWCLQHGAKLGVLKTLPGCWCLAIHEGVSLQLSEFKLKLQTQEWRVNLMRGIKVILFNIDAILNCLPLLICF